MPLEFEDAREPMCDGDLWICEEQGLTVREMMSLGHYLGEIK